MARAQFDRPQPCTCLSRAPNAKRQRSDVSGRVRCPYNAEDSNQCSGFTHLLFPESNAAVKPERVLRAIGLNGLLGSDGQGTSERRQLCFASAKRLGWRGPMLPWRNATDHLRPLRREQ